MNTRTTIAIAMMATALSVTAQDVVEQINAIKLDPQYVYGEASHENADTAFMAAVFDLKMNLEVKLKTQLDPGMLKNKVRKLSRPRGKRVKVMAYIRNEDVLGIPPAVPSIPAAPTDEDASEGIVMMPSQVPPPPPPPVQTPQPAPSATTAATPRLASLVTELMDTEHLQEALMVLEGHKRRGTVPEFAPYAKANHPKDMYLLIFDREYNIPLAVLTPEKPDGKRDNLYKNSEDALSNYADKIAVCFTIR